MYKRVWRAPGRLEAGPGYPPPSMARSPRQLLAAAVACAGGFLVLLAAIYLSWRVRWFDATAMSGFIDAQRPRVGSVMELVAHLADPGAVALFGAALAAVALARGRPRHAAAVVFLVGITSVSSQLLKAVIDYPRYEALISVAEVKPAAFPSGHSTAAMTLALCAVLVAPRLVRPLAAALGAVFALGVGYSVVALGWHFPSDVAAGFLVATGWTLATIAALQLAARRWPERTVREGARTALARATEGVARAGLLAGAVVTALVAGVFGLALVLFRLPELVGWAEGHTIAVAVGVGLAVCAAGLLAAVTAALLRTR